MTRQTRHDESAHQVAALRQDLALLTEELIARQDELVALFRLTEALSGCLDATLLFDITLAELLRLLRAEGAFAVVGERVQTAGVVSAESDTLRRLAHQIAQTGDDILWSEEQMLPHVPGTSCIVVRVVDDGAMVAALGVIGRQHGVFDYPDRKLLRVIATQVGQHLAVVRLHEQALTQVRVEAELALAREVQTNLLPKQAPQIAGVQIAGTACPAFEVGGDFFDFMRTGDDVIFTVGDVAGKGMSAAIVMSMVRTTLRNAAGFGEGVTPAMMLSYVNAGLYDDFTEIGSFATAFLGRYSASTGELHYANAGHAPVITCPRSGGARLLPADGTALGVLPDSFALDHVLRLRPGDLFVVASDGLNEARNDAGDLFGYDRLLSLVERCAAREGDSAETTMYNILDAVRAFSSKEIREDDQTLLVFKGVAR